MLTGTTILSDVTVTGATSPFGAAVALSGELDRVAIVDNHAMGVSADVLAINDSLIARNAGTPAGGIEGVGALLLRNSTVTDNTAVAPTDGSLPVVFTGGVIGSNVAAVENDTITDNHVAGDAPVLLGIDLAQVTDAALGLELRSSVIGSSVPSNDRVCGGLIESHGNNVASDKSCNLTLPSDKPNVPLKVGTLANNGGPTDTVALLANSPAIDAGADCPPADQRGITRPQGTACDAGAFESSFSAAAPAAAAPGGDAVGALPAPAPMTTAPAVAHAGARLTVAGLRRTVSRAALRRGLRLRIGANEPVIADVSVLAGRRGVELAGTSVWIGGGARTLRLRAAHRLAGHGRMRARLRVLAFDQSGNRSTTTLRFTVR